MSNRSRDIHDVIILILKVLMFTAFGYNLVRVIVKTWKYGGTTSVVETNDSNPKFIAEESEENDDEQ